METETGLDAQAADETSQTYLGRWQRLISTTNWEKGRIISEWRAALIESGAAAHQYSDEAWSRRVGQVTGQHAGRLRRVFDRFAATRETFANLYWSHFQAALDWEDAELWLEGAVQNGWSISEMRAQRSEAFGGSSEPDVDVSAELDEDYAAAEGDSLSEVRQPGGSAERADRADSEPSALAAGIDFDPQSFDREAEADAAVAVEEPHPLDSLPSLPDDLAEAFEAMKLAILRHKLSGWQEVSCEAVLTSLDALKRLTLSMA
ncbi:MAG TPA: hypothetical protein VG713_01970 [Pirellulales bacterium]|nr:hypothetical protein [Pirellulales bacterium]